MDCSETRQCHLEWFFHQSFNFDCHQSACRAIIACTWSSDLQQRWPTPAELPPACNLIVLSSITHVCRQVGPARTAADNSTGASCCNAPAAIILSWDTTAKSAVSLSPSPRLQGASHASCSRRGRPAPGRRRAGDRWHRRRRRVCCAVELGEAAGRASAAGAAGGAGTSAAAAAAAQHRPAASAAGTKGGPVPSMLCLCAYRPCITAAPENEVLTARPSQLLLACNLSVLCCAVFRVFQARKEAEEWKPRLDAAQEELFKLEKALEIKVRGRQPCRQAGR